MKLYDPVLLSEPTVGQDARAATASEMEEAERLIADLTALVDAGLIEVREHVLGPARYGVA
jgi:hypothetical protein